MGWGGVIGQALLGAIGGGAQAASKLGDEERKAEVERWREERLSAARMREHAANKTSDMAANEAKETKDRGARAEFYKTTEAAAPGQEVSAAYTDTTGDEASGESAGLITSRMKKPPTREELAKFRMEEAKKSGDEKLFKQSYEEYKDIRAEAEQERKTKFDESRATAADRMAGIRDREVAAKERDAVSREKRTDAMIAKALGGGGDGREPAKIREVKALAEIAFNGDVEKAVAFAYGMQDKPRTEAVMRMVTTLKGTDADNGKADDLLRKAEKMVDALRAKETASRGGVGVNGGDKPAPASANNDPLGIRKPASPVESKPSTAAPVAPPAKSAPAGVVEAARTDPMAAKFDDETRALETGRLRDYSPDVKAWLTAQQTARQSTNQAAENDWARRERERQLARSRGLY